MFNRLKDWVVNAYEKVKENMPKIDLKQNKNVEVEWTNDGQPVFKEKDKKKTSHKKK